MNKNPAYTTQTVLLDAHAIIHRAYHALPDFTTRDGTPTGGLYGVASMLIKIIDELDPDHIIACYDLPKPTFRHTAYKEYKGTRGETEEALRAQLDTSRDIFKAFNIPIYEQEGYEADDILGTIARQITAKEPDHQVVIASGDMDTLQLVLDDQVVVYTLKKGVTDTIVYNEERVVERYGFGSDLIPDYKGLSGDPSDNIKGVPGIGAKTATQFITHYGSIEQCLEAITHDKEAVIASGITKRMVNLLEEHAEDALFSKELATICCEVPISYSQPKTSFREGLNLASTGELFRRLEFRTLNNRLHDVLGIENQDGGSASEEASIEQEALARAKLGVYLLNPKINEPTFDDVLRYGDTFEEAYDDIGATIEQEGLSFVWKEIECPIIKAVQSMNTRGFMVDQGTLTDLSKQFHTRIDTLEKQIHAYADTPFNIKSTQQLSKVLFETLELPTKGIKKTPKGVISTKESELKKLQGEHEIIDLLLEYRGLTKLTSTYLDNILPLINEESGRLHTTFVQTGTTTGRMSSRDPNLQNIPTGGEYGKEIRTMFVPQKGYTLLSCDYSQIELRMAAQLSGDTKLVQFFADKQDIHQAVALELFGEETPEHRRKAKVINFGILYGMGAQALRINLGVDDYTLADARGYLNAYFERFPELASFLEQTKEFAHQHKYTETLFGRKRYFSDIESSVPFIRAAAERMAVNAPIQGTATADIIKLALRDVYDYIHTEKLSDSIHLLAQVHDELLFEVDNDLLAQETPKLVSLMEGVLTRYAPQVNKEVLVDLVVDYATGGNWAEAK